MDIPANRGTAPTASSLFNVGVPGFVDITRRLEEMENNNDKRLHIILSKCDVIMCQQKKMNENIRKVTKQARKLKGEVKSLEKSVKYSLGSYTSSIGSLSSTPGPMKKPVIRFEDKEPGEIDVWKEMEARMYMLKQKNFVGRKRQSSTSRRKGDRNVTTGRNSNEARNEPSPAEAKVDLMESSNFEKDKNSQQQDLILFPSSSSSSEVNLTERKILDEVSGTEEDLSFDPMEGLQQLQEMAKAQLEFLLKSKTRETKPFKAPVSNEEHQRLLTLRSKFSEKFLPPAAPENHNDAEPTNDEFNVKAENCGDSFSAKEKKKSSIVPSSQNFDLKDGITRKVWSKADFGEQKNEDVCDISVRGMSAKELEVLPIKGNPDGKMHYRDDFTFKNEGKRRDNVGPESVIEIFGENKDASNLFPGSSVEHRCVFFRNSADLKATVEGVYWNPSSVEKDKHSVSSVCVKESNFRNPRVDHYRRSNSSLEDSLKELEIFCVDETEETRYPLLNLSTSSLPVGEKLDKKCLLVFQEMEEHQKKSMISVPLKDQDHFHRAVVCSVPDKNIEFHKFSSEEANEISDSTEASCNETVPSSRTSTTSNKLPPPQETMKEGSTFGTALLGGKVESEYSNISLDAEIQHSAARFSPALSLISFPNENAMIGVLLDSFPEEKSHEGSLNSPNSKLIEMSRIRSKSRDCVVRDKYTEAITSSNECVKDSSEFGQRDKEENTSYRETLGKKYMTPIIPQSKSGSLGGIKGSGSCHRNQLEQRDNQVSGEDMAISWQEVDDLRAVTGDPKSPRAFLRFNSFPQMNSTESRPPFSTEPDANSRNSSPKKITYNAGVGNEFSSKHHASRIRLIEDTDSHKVSTKETRYVLISPNSQKRKTGMATVEEKRNSSAFPMLKCQTDSACTSAQESECCTVPKNVGPSKIRKSFSKSKEHKQALPQSEMGTDDFERVPNLCSGKEQNVQRRKHKKSKFVSCLRKILPRRKKKDETNE